MKDCLVYLKLAANPRDVLAMRRAINTPARGIGAKTELALQALIESASATPGLEAVSGPECLLALLEQDDLDDLESALATASADALGAGGGMAIASPVDGALGGGAGTSLGDDRGAGAVVAPDGAGRPGADGWKGFSVHRAWMLAQAIETGAVEGPTKSQTNRLRVFAKILCKVKVTAATEGLPELVGVVLDETGMRK